MSIVFEQQYAAQAQDSDGKWWKIGPCPVEGDALTNDDWTTREIADRRAEFAHTNNGGEYNVRVVSRMISEEIVEHEF